MRTLIVSNLMSLDGYVDGPGGDFMRLPVDAAFSPHNVERLRAADTLLLGRTTYDGFRSYWPAVAADDTQPPLEREIAEHNAALEKVVVSDTLTADATDPWRETTRIVRRPDAHEAIADLKHGEGGDILTFGSITLTHDLLTAGLVDELNLIVGNAAIGDGVPAFPNPTGRMRLLDASRLPESDNVLLRYAPMTP